MCMQGNYETKNAALSLRKRREKLEVQQHRTIRKTET